MGEEFRDNLQVGEEVYIPGDERVHTYRGFEGHNTRRCAIGLRDDPQLAWFDRRVITPAGERPIREEEWLPPGTPKGEWTQPAVRRLRPGSAEGADGGIPDGNSPQGS